MRYDAARLRRIAELGLDIEQVGAALFCAVDENDRLRKQFGANGFSWYPCGCTVGDESVCKEHQGPGPYPFSEGP
jgi:hypothetical protein